MVGGLSPWHLAIVLAVVLILFGSKKLPDAARGLGRSMRIFKSEIKEMQNDDSADQQHAPQELAQGGQPQAAQFVQPQAGTQQTPAAPQNPPQQFTDPAGPPEGGQAPRGQ